jgi:hypothetical protein
MKTTYRISSSFLIGDFQQLLCLVFPAWNGEPVYSSEYLITVTFDTPQTPADLGPLVKVEILPTE